MWSRSRIVGRPRNLDGPAPEKGAPDKPTNMQNAHFERLVSCFERVFPNLDRSAIPTATPGSVAEWDSIAQVTLMSLVGEEFGIEIDFEEFEDARSFGAVLELLRVRTGNA